MAEYIERERAMQIAFTSPFFSNALMEEIKAIPAADVAPVVHGRWVYHNFDTICSECRKSAIFDEWEQQAETEFCPHCGAKMDEEAVK